MQVNCIITGTQRKAVTMTKIIGLLGEVSVPRSRSRCVSSDAEAILDKRNNQRILHSKSYLGDVDEGN